jgi:hypothetical protein
MHYDIQIGFLAADAISEFSKAAVTKDVTRYAAFLARTAEYCRAVRQTYGHPVETDIPTAIQGTLADFMRTVVRTHRPSPAVAAKLQAVATVEGLLESIREEHRTPSDEECLGIAKTIYVTSAADPR